MPKHNQDPEPENLKGPRARLKRTLGATAGSKAEQGSPSTPEIDAIPPESINLVHILDQPYGLAAGDNKTLRPGRGMVHVLQQPVLGERGGHEVSDQELAAVLIVGTPSDRYRIDEDHGTPRAAYAMGVVYERDQATGNVISVTIAKLPIGSNAPVRGGTLEIVAKITQNDLMDPNKFNLTIGRDDVDKKNTYLSRNHIAVEVKADADGVRSLDYGVSITNISRHGVNVIDESVVRDLLRQDEVTHANPAAKVPLLELSALLDSNPSLWDIRLAGVSVVSPGNWQEPEAVDRR